MNGTDAMQVALLAVNAAVRWKAVGVCGLVSVGKMGS